MTYREIWRTIKIDFFRLDGQINPKLLIYNALFGEGFSYIFWMRLARFSKMKRLHLLHFIARINLRRSAFRLGISIPYVTKIGDGLCIKHFGGIVVNEDAIIGSNCNISQGVTIGKANRGPRKGCAVIGDNVYIGPGAKIVGAVTIGNHAAIGANCVVTKDIPEFAVVVGVPGKIISMDGSADYITHVEYDSLLA